MAGDRKARVRDFWESNPCGAKFASAELGSREFFEQVDRYRSSTEWHIAEVIGFQKWRSRDVLEVGCGLGGDGAKFARAGARYVGVDITRRAIELARRRFGLEGLSGLLIVADAEDLPFADSSFDLVYSHGVLHHTPDIERAISEIHRVLRPGGVAMVMLYHRASYNYYVNIMFLRRLGAHLLGFDWGPKLISKLTGESQARLMELQQLYRQDRRSLLERDFFLSQNTDGAGNPLSRAYSRREALRLFERFSNARAEAHFLNKRWIPLLGRLITRKMERRLARLIGWHLWIIARK
jgi:SAM-dependent methyltransferase